MKFATHKLADLDRQKERVNGFFFLSSPINNGFERIWLAEENISLSKLTTLSVFFFVGIVLNAKKEKITTEINKKKYLTDLIIKEYCIDITVYRVNE